MTRVQWIKYCERLIDSGKLTPEEAVALVRHLYHWEKIFKIKKKLGQNND